MKKLLIIAIIIFISAITHYVLIVSQVEVPGVLEKEAEKKANIDKNAEMPKQAMDTTDLQIVSGLQSPLTRAGERVTKKPFGIFITPHNSPVQPERFRGYHAGTDFEVFPEELDIDVEVKAICSGELKLKTITSGYGGVAVQVCHSDGNPMTVIYGHLKLSSVSKNIGERVEAGEILGILGQGFSAETDGERKHLHLGVHKGSEINILGYAQSKASLSDWIDACVYVCE